MRWQSFLAYTLVVIVTGVSQAQTHTIKIKEQADVGKSVTVRDFEKNRGSVKVLVGDMVVNQENKENEGKDEAYTEVVLQAGDKRPKKYKRTYTKAVTIEGNKEKATGYQGRTIIYELKGDKYEVMAEGEPALAPQDVAKLAKEANDKTGSELEKAFLPGKAVKVGESWKIDEKKIVEAFGKDLKVDPIKTRGEGKLVRAYKKGTQQFGVLEYQIKLSVKSLGPLTLDTPLGFDLELILDTAIDGSTTQGKMMMNGKMKGTTSFQMGGQKFTIEMDLQVNGQREQTAEQ